MLRKILLKNASSLASTAYYDEIWLVESCCRVLVEQTQVMQSIRPPTDYPYGSAMRQYTSSVSTENVSKFKYQGRLRQSRNPAPDGNGMQRVDMMILGVDCLIRRLGEVCRWIPKVGKYVGISPFSMMANNPINYIDPDGRDVGFHQTLSGEVKGRIKALYIGSKTFRTAYNSVRADRSVVWYVRNFTLAEAKKQKNDASTFFGETTVGQGTNGAWVEKQVINSFFVKSNLLIDQKDPAHELLHAIKYIYFKVNPKMAEAFNQSLTGSISWDNNNSCEPDPYKFANIIEGEMKDKSDDLNETNDKAEIDKIFDSTTSESNGSSYEDILMSSFGYTKEDISKMWENAIKAYNLNKEQKK